MVSYRTSVIAQQNTYVAVKLNGFSETNSCLELLYGYQLGMYKNVPDPRSHQPNRLDRACRHDPISIFVFFFVCVNAWV